MKVLVAEDDPLIREGLIDILQAEGYITVEAADGNEALAKYKTESPEFICLDIMMPEQSGFDVCRTIRQHDPAIPIIFVSAKSEEIDKVVGLELGADDFIVKPFGVKEVVARIRAVTRRCLAAHVLEEKETPFNIEHWTVFPAQLRARKKETQIELSVREIRLLRLFADNPDTVLSRDAIFTACWNESFFPSSRTLDQHIVKLRKKIETDPKQPMIIQTVHGTGYRYSGDV
ncbi:MAG: response regulator transcription factor [Deltaproteobacteria bacterium]|nr:response regulator transcription factor [Deltaproteobacteria bacterium]MBN2671360.1 response regulator transcription factor [Deltaproteobacteria bacterium]